MPTQEKGNVAIIEVNGMDRTNSIVEDDINSTNRIHAIEDGEERGVYFLDGLRKIDLVLAYEGINMKLTNFL
jgi:hypothetical protein